MIFAEYITRWKMLVSDARIRAVDKVEEIYSKMKQEKVPVVTIFDTDRVPTQIHAPVQKRSSQYDAS